MKKNTLFFGIGAVALIASAGVIGVAVFGGDDSVAPTTASTSQPTASSTATTSTASSSTNTSTKAYTDGSYDATVSYSVPHGETNSIGVTVTVSDGTITKVSVDDQYTDRESGMHISSFESALNASANGASLASYSPSRIGGASLTTEAFSEAIDQIRSDPTA